MSALSERLKETAKPARQLALEAAAENLKQRQQDAEHEAQQQRDALRQQLEQLLPDDTYRFVTLTAAEFPTLLQATRCDNFVVSAVIDADTENELCLILGPRLIGECPGCGSLVPSEQINTLAQLGDGHH